MAMAIEELFLSSTTYGVLCEAAAPQPFIQLIEYCKKDAFDSVVEMVAKTREMLASASARVQNMSVSALAEARLSQYKVLAKSEDGWRDERITLNLTNIILGSPGMLSFLAFDLYLTLPLPTPRTSP
ncbi:hypothetical protein F5146DRAFT_1140822 [Armillaria mellea]|nr:hypothetical protein F5146DRAFT_1140822 [Armillaria mellea]